jgi:dTDP-4-dehydrorhamnose reductase
MRILVLGKNGQVGYELGRQLAGREDVLMAGRADCDLSNQQSIRELVRHAKPEVIVNAAAYTAVDLAEKERDLCFAINAVAPAVLAEEAARLHALLIHYSTDYVFDGEKQTPWVETDPVRPLNVYGASKAEGEAAIAQRTEQHLTLRTSWVYGARGKNFLLTMLRLGAERKELRVVDDQVGSPTSASAIAAATLRLVDEYEAIGAQMPAGTYHMTATGSTSWFGFARNIFEVAQLPQPPHVHAIPASEFPTPARRPAWSVLSNDKFAQAFGFRLPGWREQLEDVVAEVLTSR